MVRKRVKLQYDQYSHPSHPLFTSPVSDINTVLTKCVCFGVGDLLVLNQAPLEDHVEVPGGTLTITAF